MKRSEITEETSTSARVLTKSECMEQLEEKRRQKEALQEQKKKREEERKKKKEEKKLEKEMKGKKVVTSTPSKGEVVIVYVRMYNPYIQSIYGRRT